MLMIELFTLQHHLTLQANHKIPTMKASLSIMALLASIAMASPTLRSRQINDLPPCEIAGEFIKGGIYTSRE